MAVYTIGAEVTAQNVALDLAGSMLVSGSDSIYQLSFTFSDEWDGYTKKVVFESEPKRSVIEVLLSGTNILTIPVRSLAYPGFLRVGVRGIGTNDEVMPTVWSEKVSIFEGTRAGYENPPAPDPDVYEEILAAMAGKQDLLTFDDVPTEDSDNPVKSNGIYEAVEALKTMLDAAVVKETVSGTDSANFSDGEGYPFTSLKVSLLPKQELNGYDKPWSGGNGKNLFPTTITTQTYRGVTFTADSKGVITATGTSTGSIASGNVTLGRVTLPAGRYTASVGRRRTMLYNETADTSIATLGSDSYNESYTFTLTEESSIHMHVVMPSGQDATGYEFYPMICLSSATDPTVWEPYENICPITGWEGTSANLSAEETGGTEYAVTWEDEVGYIYGGIVDIISGLLTVTHRSYLFSDISSWNYNATMKSFRAGSTNTGGWATTIRTYSDGGQLYGNCMCSGYPISNAATNAQMAAAEGTVNIGGTLSVYRLLVNDPTFNGDVNAFKAARANVRFVYELALSSRQTYQLTPQQINTLVGQNYIWSDDGSIEGTYIVSTKAYVDSRTGTAQTLNAVRPALNLGVVQPAKTTAEQTEEEATE